MSKAQVVTCVILLGIVGWWAYQQYSPSPPQGQISSQPDAELVQFKQMKLDQVSQVDVKLNNINNEITNMEVEIERLRSLIKPGMHRVTPEELKASLVLPGLIEDLDELKNELIILIAKKQYLEQDVAEVEQYTTVDDYYKFKQAQLDELTKTLIELRLDIDLGVAGAQQDYDRLLPQRGSMQQDIWELEQLL